MNVRIEVRELVLQGLPREQAHSFVRHLEREVARLVASGALGGAPGHDAPAGARSIDHVRIERERPVTTASEAAADVARAVAQGLGR